MDVMIVEYDNHLPYSTLKTFCDIMYFESREGYEYNRQKLVDAGVHVVTFEKSENIRDFFLEQRRYNRNHRVNPFVLLYQWSTLRSV